MIIKLSVLLLHGAKAITNAISLSCSVFCAHAGLLSTIISDAMKSPAIAEKSVTLLAYRVAQYKPPRRKFDITIGNLTEFCFKIYINVLAIFTHIRTKLH